MAANPMPAAINIESDAELVTLADVDAAVGAAPIPPDEQNGVIYRSDEEFSAHLEAQPFALSGD